MAMSMIHVQGTATTIVTKHIGTTIVIDIATTIVIGVHDLILHTETRTDKSACCELRCYRLSCHSMA